MTASVRRLATAGAVVIAVIVLVLLLAERGHWGRGVLGGGRATQSAATGKAETAAKLRLGSRRAILQSVPCSLSYLVDELRSAAGSGSPAYLRYLQELVREHAAGLPTAEVLALLDAERDPTVLEALGAVLARRWEEERDPALLRALLARYRGEADPSLRAALVRALGATDEPSALLLAQAKGGTTYEQMLQDASPVVAAAAVDTLIEQTGRDFGRDAALADVAVEAAIAARDPAQGARLLEQISVEHASPAAVGKVIGELRSDSSAARGAAATALGTAGASDAQRAMRALADAYRRETDRAVRRSILASIARIGFADAVPVLASLRGVDPTLDGEIDLWIIALGRSRQEWALVERARARLEAAQAP